jgi:hypothetical protein
MIKRKKFTLWIYKRVFSTRLIDSPVVESSKTRCPGKGIFGNIFRGPMKKYLLVILLVFIFPLTIWGKTPTFVPQRTIALVFTSNVHGEVEPCG